MKIFITMVIGATISLAEIMTVSKVVDGDTIYFKHMGKTIKCRVAFIDAPESRKNTKAKKDTEGCLTTLDYMVAAGNEASRYAKRKLPVGSKHKVNIIDRDRYKRAICEIDNYGTSIVMDGYAYPYFKYIPKNKHRKYIVNVRYAKSHRLGLWRKYPSAMKCLEKKRQKELQK